MHENQLFSANLGTSLRPLLMASYGIWESKNTRILIFYPGHNLQGPRPFRTVGKFGKNMKFLFKTNMGIMVLDLRVKLDGKTIPMVHFDQKWLPDPIGPRPNLERGKNMKFLFHLYIGMMVLDFRVKLDGKTIAMVLFDQKSSPDPIGPATPKFGAWENMKFLIHLFIGMMVLYIRVKLDGKTVEMIHFDQK